MRRFVGAELARDIDVLVDRDTHRDVGEIAQLAKRQAQADPVEHREALERPAAQHRADLLVELGAFGPDLFDQGAGEGTPAAAVQRIGGEEFVHHIEGIFPLGGILERVEKLEGPLAGEMANIGHRAGELVGGRAGSTRNGVNCGSIMAKYRLIPLKSKAAISSCTSGRTSRAASEG